MKSGEQKPKGGLIAAPDRSTAGEDVGDHVATENECHGAFMDAARKSETDEESDQGYLIHMCHECVLAVPSPAEALLSRKPLPNEVR